MWLFDNLTIAPWAGWLTVSLASWGLMSTIAVGTWRAASRAWDRPPPPEDLELPPLPPERSWEAMTGPQTAVDYRNACPVCALTDTGWICQRDLGGQCPMDTVALWKCPVCHDPSPEPGFCYRDHREDPPSIHAWGPAALPRPDPRSQLAALMADVMGPEDERLAAPIVPEWVNADLEKAGFKTYETNTAAVDSMVMRAIQ
jgi:hypothetical protein